MLKIVIKLLLVYCGVYKKPVYVRKQIVCRGRLPERVSRIPFDREFYLECYDDIRENGIDPVQHFYYFGRSEGRIGTPLVPRINSEVIDKERDSVLLVTHELSPTGAPILAYNIAKELCKKYNIFIMSLGKGDLYEEFLKLGCNLFCEPGFRRSEPIAKYFLDRLNGVVNIKFAVVNSIESASVLPGLYRLNIPIVSLVHEFPSYSGGLDRFRRCIYWSTRVLLSSELAKSELLKTGQVADSEKIAVLPQGKCLVPSFDRKIRAELPLSKSDGVIRIIGAGTITYRKGVDLFIESARQIRDSLPSCRVEFMWIGKNVDSALGADYFQYLEDQVGRAGVNNSLSFIDETDNYEEILGSADVFLMTSRLDPLPNVAIDGFANSVPVFFFRGASGLSSLICNTPLEKILCADYICPSSMASKVVQYILGGGKEDAQVEIRKLYDKHFRFESYINKLEVHAKEAIDDHVQMAQDVDFLRENRGINTRFCKPKIWDLFGDEDLVKRYVNMWKSNIYKYRPAPNFHPSIYREIVSPQGDPYAHYIRSGRPLGPWESDLVDLTPQLLEPCSEQSVALHIHCYYPELLDDILSRLIKNRSKVDVFVSTNTEEKKEAISLVFERFGLVPASIDISPNLGRDIGPFLNMYARDFSERYDVTFHLHTKKSPHVLDEDGRNWYEYCLENLLGGIGGNVLDKILCEFRDGALGLVYPSDPNSIGWGGNYEYSEKVLGRLGLKARTGDFNFPVGTMFAASKALVGRLADLNFSWDEFPCEPLPIDGTMLHAIERSIPYISEGLGLRQMQVYVDKTTRV